MTHPGYPVLAQGDLLSVSRVDINEALEHILVQTLASDVEVDPTLGRYIFMDCTSGNLILSLPDPTADATVQGIRLHFKRTVATANTCTIDTTGSPLIDGSASVTLAAQYNRTTLYSDATQWWIEEAG